MTAKWSNRKQCSAVNCKNYQCKCPQFAFHRFPNDHERCAKWVQNLKNESLKGVSYERLRQNYRVCSAHFDPSQFKRSSDVHAGLKWNAVPTIVDAPNKPPQLDLKCKRKSQKTQRELPPKKRKQSHVHTNARASKKKFSQQPVCSETAEQTGVADTSLPLTPQLPPTGSAALEAAARERALKLKIRSLNSQVCRLKMKVRELNRLKKSRRPVVSKESVMKRLKKLLPTRTYCFVSAQIRAYERKASALRWTIQDKTFFLYLLNVSPKCYRLLFKVFSIPSVRTLQKLMKSIDFQPGLIHNNPSTRQKTMETTKPMDELSALLTDDTSLKQSIENHDCTDSKVSSQENTIR